MTASLERATDNESPAGARRVRRALRRRKEILAAALTVFKRVGIVAANTRLIAAEADLSESTIYNHFPDKDELCIQALKEGSRLETLVASMQQADGPIEDLFGSLADWRANDIQRQSAMLELLAQTLADPKLRARYREVIWEPAVQAVAGALARRKPLGLAAVPAARLILSSTIGLWLMSLADAELQDLLTSDGAAAHRLRNVLLRGLADPRVANGPTPKRRRVRRDPG